MKEYAFILLTYAVVFIAWFGSLWLFTYPPEGWDESIFYRNLGWVVLGGPFVIVWGLARDLSRAYRASKSSNEDFDDQS